MDNILYPNRFWTKQLVYGWSGRDPMIRTIFTTAILVSVFATGFFSPNASAQDAILAQMYGRGVHAFNSGNYTDANRFLSAAINGGTKDPRAYYFRGIVASVQGMQYQAEGDWAQGAQLEAKMGTTAGIGRSLSRFQGSARLKLEQIRQEARLQQVISANANSTIRSNEIQAAQPAVVAQPVPVVPRSSNPITPPPTPPTADNPFADDPLVAGDPKLEADDALKGSMDPLAADPNAAAAPAAAPAGGDPFGGGGAPAAGGDPFGGGAPAAGGDPFGGGGAPAAGGDPFGGGADAGGAMDDPFGSDPFGN